MTYIVTKRKTSKAHEAAMEQGLRTLLRQQLIDYHRQYVASGGPCPVRIKEQATAVHDAYATPAAGAWFPFYATWVIE